MTHEERYSQIMERGKIAKTKIYDRLGLKQEDVEYKFEKDNEVENYYDNIVNIDKISPYMKPIRNVVGKIVNVIDESKLFESDYINMRTGMGPNNVVKLETVAPYLKSVKTFAEKICGVIDETKLFESDYVNIRKT